MLDAAAAVLADAVQDPRDRRDGRERERVGPVLLERRVEDALDSVRPYLGSHGGDVHLLEVDGEVVRLQFAL